MINPRGCELDKPQFPSGDLGAGLEGLLQERDTRGRREVSHSADVSCGQPFLIADPTLGHSIFPVYEFECDL